MITSAQAANTATAGSIIQLDKRRDKLNPSHRLSRIADNKTFLIVLIKQFGATRELYTPSAVSYTHLDVYKRQIQSGIN